MGRFRYLLANEFLLSVESEPAIAGAAGFDRWRALVASGEHEIGFDTGAGCEDEDEAQTAELRFFLFDSAWADWEQSARFAEIVQNWRRTDDGLWLLVSMRVGPTQVFRFPDSQSQ